jgi:mannitol/fructose-specific phosphotransferase system IIA component (Ntr-type)
MSAVEQIAASFGFSVVILPVTVAESTQSAIRFLVERLSDGGLILTQDVEKVVSNAMKRESLGSTALGGGFAMPHMTSTAVNRVMGILAHCSSPVPWDSPDGQGIRTICLILSPTDRPGDYMRALEQVTRQ